MATAEQHFFVTPHTKFENKIREKWVWESESESENRKSFILPLFYEHLLFHSACKSPHRMKACATWVTMKTMGQSFSSKKRIAKCVHNNVKTGREREWEKESLNITAFTIFCFFSRWNVCMCTMDKIMLPTEGMNRYNSILAFRLDKFIFRSWKIREKNIKSKAKCAQWDWVREAMW